MYKNKYANFIMNMQIWNKYANIYINLLGTQFQKLIENIVAS